MMKRGYIARNWVLRGFLQRLDLEMEPVEGEQPIEMSVKRSKPSFSRMLRKALDEPSAQASEMFSYLAKLGAADIDHPLYLYVGPAKERVRVVWVGLLVISFLLMLQRDGCFLGIMVMVPVAVLWAALEMGIIFRDQVLRIDKRGIAFPLLFASRAISWYQVTEVTVESSCEDCTQLAVDIQLAGSDSVQFTCSRVKASELDQLLVQFCARALRVRFDSTLRSKAIRVLELEKGFPEATRIDWFQKGDLAANLASPPAVGDSSGLTAAVEHFTAEGSFSRMPGKVLDARSAQTAEVLSYLSRLGAEGIDPEFTLSVEPEKEKVSLVCAGLMVCSFLLTLLPILCLRDWRDIQALTVSIFVTSFGLLVAIFVAALWVVVEKGLIFRDQIMRINERGVAFPFSFFRRKISWYQIDKVKVESLGKDCTHVAVGLQLTDGRSVSAFSSSITASELDLLLLHLYVRAQRVQFDPTLRPKGIRVSELESGFPQTPCIEWFHGDNSALTAAIEQSKAEGFFRRRFNRPRLMKINAKKPILLFENNAPSKAKGGAND